MPTPAADPMSSVFTLPFVLGAILAVVCWLFLVVAAFKEKASWGLLVLAGPFVVDAIAGRNVWVSTIGSLLVILPFALPRFDQRKIAVCFALVALGSVMIIPGTNRIYALAE